MAKQVLRGRFILGRSGLLRFVGCLAVVAIGCASANAQHTPQKIAYGNKAGMYVTVTSSSSLGTANAVIAGRFTESDASAVCLEYDLDNSKACVQRTLDTTKLVPEVRANCVTGRFTTFYGRGYQFVGKFRTQASYIGGPEFNFIDLERHESLDGSSASSYDVVFETFEALCPGREKLDVPGGERLDSAGAHVPMCTTCGRSGDVIDTACRNALSARLNRTGIDRNTLEPMVRKATLFFQGSNTNGMYSSHIFYSYTATVITYKGGSAIDTYGVELDCIIDDGGRILDVREKRLN